jgi:hypothetical protein
MKIKVIDGFGSHVGDAEVTWVPASTEGIVGYENMDELNAVIFAPAITVLLPTLNERIPWRLDITP